MTMTLKAQDMHARLQVLQDWERRKYDAQALDKRRAEWTAQCKKLKKVVEQLEWIGNREHALTECQSQVKLVRALVAKATETLQDGGGDERLTHEDHWAKILNATEKLVSQLNEFVVSGWNAFVANLGNLPQPATIRATLPLSRPGNRQAFDDYSETHSRFQRVARTDGPATQEDVFALRRLALLLGDTAARFNFSEVPEAVSEFYMAISSGKGAPLALFTNEVRAWLEAEGQAEAFMVVSR
jgi:hypothetical protein